MSFLTTPHFYIEFKGYCEACGNLESHPLHVVTERAIDESHDTEDLQMGDFVYLDIGSIDLTISKGHTRESLEKLHAFIGNLLAKKL